MKFVVAHFALAAVMLTTLAAEQPPLKVTVRQLLETPEKFAGKRVDVRGYHRTGTEDSCLIACENCAQSPDPTEKSIWLDPLVWDPRYYPAAPSPGCQVRRGRQPDDSSHRHLPLSAPADSRQDVPYEFRYRGFGCYKMWSREIADITYIQPLR